MVAQNFNSSLSRPTAFFIICNACVFVQSGQLPVDIIQSKLVQLRVNKISGMTKSASRNSLTGTPYHSSSFPVGEQVKSMTCSGLLLLAYV